jgi:hypothetical protein
MNQSSRTETWVGHPERGGRQTPSHRQSTGIKPGNRAGSLRPAPKGRGPGEKCGGQRPRSEKVPVGLRLENGTGQHQDPLHPSRSSHRERESGLQLELRQAGKPTPEPDYGRSRHSGRKADLALHCRLVRDWGSNHSLPKVLNPSNSSTPMPARSVPTSEGLPFARNVSSKLHS